MRTNWYFFRRYSHYFTYSIKYVLVFVIFIIFVSPYLKKGKPMEENFYLKKYSKVSENSSNECQTLKLNPFDPSILKYWKKQTPLVCESVQEQLARFADGVLTFDPKAASLSCQKLTIKHDDGVSDANAVFKDKIEYDLSKGLTFNVTDEFFEISCKAGGLVPRTTFKKSFAQIEKKELNVEKSKEYKILDTKLDRPPVVIIGLDSMSRSNFVRQMPKTRKILEATGFIDLEGYNKVWDNTYNNLVASLMGKNGEFDAEIDESWDIAFDKYDFIWKDFAKSGYATLFAEDRPDIGTFNYMGKLKGFIWPTVTHYFRTFWLATYWTKESLGSIPFCYDDVPKHVVQLNYLQDYIRKYQKQRHFAFWWTQDMSHDYLNTIAKADIDFFNFFVSNEQYLKDSIVIVMADHGNRYDPIRETEVGRLESRLPIFSIRIPERLKKEYPEMYQNLLGNRDRLVTPYDLHETLHQIAAGKIGKPMKYVTKNRGNSLFSKIPSDRTCKQAHIPEQYCPCFKEIPITEEEARDVIEVFYEHLNDLLLSFRESQDQNEDDTATKKYYCAPLQQSQFISGSVRVPPKGMVQTMRSDVELETMTLRYRVVTKTDAPSNALLEGIVVRDLKFDVLTSTGEIERNNAYGNSSHCVIDPILKKICHCVLE